MELRFAQKGIILDSTKTKILLLKASSAKYQSAKLSGKYVLPGGKIDDGEEDLDAAFIREVKEETGVKIIPGDPIYNFTFSYQKETQKTQIVISVRLATYGSGDLLDSKIDVETEYDFVGWVDIKDLNLEDVVWDAAPSIAKYIENKELYDSLI